MGGQVLNTRLIQSCRWRGWLTKLGIGLLGCGLASMTASEELSTSTSNAGATALFESDEVLEVQLHGPIKKLLADTANRQRNFQIIAKGIQQPVGIRTGGKSRRRFCDFLPLRLDFEAIMDRGSPNPNSIFKGHQFLYLTTQCNFTARSQADLIEEYLAYRILNLITDSSYRVRLLRVNYVDTRQADKSVTHHAFVTESEHALARRMGGKILEISHISKRLLNEDHAALIYVFQYLIGNTDWSLVTGTGDDTCCHNGQLIGVGAKIFYVPFDFDMSGLVNPRYAQPDSSLSIKRVTQRIYRGYCGPEDALRRALEHVIAQREAILNIYRQAPELSKKDRDKGIRFLNRFSEEAKDPEKLLAMFQRRCLE